MPASVVFAIIIGVFAFGGAFFALSLAWEDIMIRTRYEKCSGKVINISHLGESEGMVKYPTVKFRDRYGREVCFESPRGFADFKYNEGDEVDIAYHPKRPIQAAVIHKPMDFQKLPLVIAIASIVSLAAAIAIILADKPMG